MNKKREKVSIILSQKKECYACIGCSVVNLANTAKWIDSLSLSQSIHLQWCKWKRQWPTVFGNILVTGESRNLATFPRMTARGICTLAVGPPPDPGRVSHQGGKACSHPQHSIENHELAFWHRSPLRCSWFLSNQPPLLALSLSPVSVCVVHGKGRYDGR